MVYFYHLNYKFEYNDIVTSYNDLVNIKVTCRRKETSGKGDVTIYHQNKKLIKTSLEFSL